MQARTARGGSQAGLSEAVERILIDKHVSFCHTGKEEV